MALGAISLIGQLHIMTPKLMLPTPGGINVAKFNLQMSSIFYKKCVAVGQNGFHNLRGCCCFYSCAIHLIGQWIFQISHILHEASSTTCAILCSMCDSSVHWSIESLFRYM